MKRTAMTLEIIIIAIFASAAMLAAVLAVHNIQNLNDTSAKYNKLLGAQALLEAEIKTLRDENFELEQALETERVNSDMLRQTLLDTIISAAEDSEPEEEVLQANAKERLPEGVATNRYDCEGFSFPEGTAQYKLQQLCTTDWETGTRIFTRDNIRYRCVAMGTAYGIDIGDAWEVTLHNGYTFPVVLADYQHDISFIDPNDFGERFVYDDNGDIIDNLRNYDGDPVVHVLEFIADLDAMPQAAKDAGGMHGLTIFGGKYGPGGNIVNLKYLGRVWEP